MFNALPVDIDEGGLDLSLVPISGGEFLRNTRYSVQKDGKDFPTGEFAEMTIDALWKGYEEALHRRPDLRGKYDIYLSVRGEQSRPLFANAFESLISSFSADKPEIVFHFPEGDDEGPVMVIYPEETWYTFVDKEDVDEIIDQHLVAGNIVERLKI